MARRGYLPFGIDISDVFIDLACKYAEQERLLAEFVRVDARHFATDRTFDAAICICEGAFGLAGADEDHLNVLRNVANHLKTGGRFLLTAISSFGSVRRLNAEMPFDPYTATTAETETIRDTAGNRRQATIYTTTFTYRELKLMLESTGFRVVAAYGVTAGDFQRKPLTLDDVEIMMVAERVL